MIRENPGMNHRMFGVTIQPRRGEITKPRLKAWVARSPMRQALKGRDSACRQSDAERYPAPSGLGSSCYRQPRPSAWALLSHPFGAAVRPTLLLLAGLTAAVCAAPARALDIVRDGKPAAVVVLPAQASLVEQEAARLLVLHTQQATGAALRVVSEGDAAAAGGAAIHVGWTKAARQAGLTPEGLVSDSYRMRVRGQTLFLAGHDLAGVKPQSFQGARGTLFAVMEFLRDFAGVYWLMPGPEGVWAARRATVTVPDTLERTHVPHLKYGMVRMDRYYPWSLANGARAALNLYSGGGHTWAQGIPGGKYGKEHPEYFAEIGGQRQSQPAQYLKDNQRQGTVENPMLCTSNPQFVPLMTAWVQQKFDEGFDIVELGESDGLRVCECRRCVELFGDPTTLQGKALRIYLPHREIAERCLKSHPDKKIMLLVYGRPRDYLFQEPNHGVTFPANVLGECTDVGAIGKIQRVIPTITTYNYYWLTGYRGLSPKQSLESIANQMRKLVAVGSLGTYYCGGGENWAAEGASFYVGLRTAQDPAYEPQYYLKEYCTGLYGAAATTMAAYYELLYQRIPNKPDDGGMKFDVPKERWLNEKFVQCWPASSLEQMSALLAKAEAEAAGDARALNWLRLARIGFEQVRCTAAVYHAHRAYEAAPSKEKLLAIRNLIVIRQQFVDKIKNLEKADPRFVATYFPSYKIFVQWVETEARTVPLGPPFTWEIDKALAEGKLP